jgi:hypothetical protein
MKKIVLVLLIVLTCKISAQEKTLLSSEIVHGGYGGPEVKFTQIDQNFAVLVGGKGGWIINHTFVLGAGGYGLVNNIDAKRTLATGERPLLALGYGGLFLEYIQDWDQLLHYSFSAIIGGGIISYRHRDNNDMDDDFARKNFFIVEPAANGEVNITSFFRINLGVSYRLLSSVDFDGFNDQNLGGLSANLTFKFGKF